MSEEKAVEKEYTYEVTATVTFSESFDWQAQADEWWHGDVALMQERLVEFMVETDSDASRWEGGDIPNEAVRLQGPDWTLEETRTVS